MIHMHNFVFRERVQEEYIEGTGWLIKDLYVCEICGKHKVKTIKTR